MQTLRATDASLSQRTNVRRDDVMLQSPEASRTSSDESSEPDDNAIGDDKRLADDKE